MINQIYKVIAFLRRDFKTELSYRFSFLLNLAGISFSVIMFYYISKLFGKAASPYLEDYGGDYFSFVIIGIAFSGYLSVSLHSFSGAIREGQMLGTLEAMMVTPTGIPAIILFSGLWSFISTTVEVIIYLLAGVIIFGLDLGKANILSAITVMILTILSFSPLGVISASFIMAFKRGDPIAFLFGSASSLLGGVYYPITILPSWLQDISHLLPITYSLRAMRYSLIKGSTLSEISSDLFALGFFSAFMIPLSLMAFSYAVRKAKEKGSLGQY
ncbi:MAG: ABC transporter permease [Nitrospirota bacterium]